MAFSSTRLTAERDLLVKHMLTERDNPTEEYVTHNKISLVTSVKYGSGRYRCVVASAIKVLRKEHHIHLSVINGKGYKIGTSGDCVDYLASGITRTRRAMRKCNGVSSCVNSEHLTNHQKNEFNSLQSIVGVIGMFTSPSAVKKVDQIALDKKAQIDAGDLARLFGS